MAIGSKIGGAKKGRIRQGMKTDEGKFDERPLRDENAESGGGGGNDNRRYLDVASGTASDSPPQQQQHDADDPPADSDEVGCGSGTRPRPHNVTHSRRLRRHSLATRPGAHWDRWRSGQAKRRAARMASPTTGRCRSRWRGCWLRLATPQSRRHSSRRHHRRSLPMS